MLRSTTLAALLASVVATAAVLSACGGGEGSTAGGASGGSTFASGGSFSGSANAGTAGASAGTAGTTGMGGSTIDIPETVGFELEPTSIDIEVVNGVASPVQLTALALRDNGAKEPVTPSKWSIDGAVATVDAQGNVTPHGSLGGAATVTAEWNGFSATTAVTVRLVIDTSSPDFTPADETALDGAVTPDATTTWLYPYDGTVFPQGLLPPRLMWNGFVAGDKMRLQVSSTYAEYTAYFSPAEGAHTIDASAWTQITESSDGSPVSIRVHRLDAANTASVVIDHSWRFATGSLRGSVYYWANSPGRVLRIAPGAGTPEDFLANAGVTDGCTTCHTVSANGNVLVMGNGKAQAAEDSDASVFDLESSSLSASGRGRGWALSALTPDGAYAVMNSGLTDWRWIGNDMPGIYDVATGAPVSGTGLDGRVVGLPAFSPDGNSLLFIEPTSRDLHAMDVNLAGGVPQVDNERKVALAANGATIAYPSVTPDGAWVVYHRGPYDTRSGAADLFLASLDGSMTEIALDNLNGATYPFGAGDRDRHWNYEPTFAPVSTGGYFWVVFTSRRTLGNQLTAGAESVKQLWVAAVDLNPQPGVDPSHPPFWVPGQDPAQPNMRGFWALDPCKDQGESCSVSSECCNGSCIDDGSGTLVCGTPDDQTCEPEGALCETDDDCCEGQCINSHCAQPPPK